VLACALFASAMLLGSPAAAQDDKARADALYKEGASLLKAEKFEEACSKLEESQKLDPAIGTLGLLAFCREKQGRTATAWRMYQDAADMAAEAGQKKRRRAAEKAAQRLEATLSKLTIQVKSPIDGIEVRRDGEVIKRPLWGTAIPVDPGSVEVTAWAPGYEAFQKTIEVAADGASVTLEIPALVKAKETAAPPPEPPKQPDKPKEPKPAVKEGPRDMTLIYVAAGVGGAGVLAGTFFGWRAGKKNDESMDYCRDNGVDCYPKGVELRDSAFTAAKWSNITFAIGAAGLGAAAYLYFSGYGKPTSEKKGAAHSAPLGFGAAPATRGRGASAVLTGSF
jgi:serine/threonine-protein kinase